MPRRFATREELLALPARARRRARPDADGARPRRAPRAACRRSRSTGTRSARSSNALREAGFDVAVGEERLERAVEQGAELARRARPAAEVRRLGRGAPRGRRDADRVAGLPHVRLAARGAWATFQFLVRERLRRRGRRRPLRRARWLPRARAAIVARRVRQNSRSCGARTAGSGSSSTNSFTRKRSRALDLAGAERDERALGQLALAQLQAAVALDDLERVLRRGEEDRRRGSRRATAAGRAARRVEQLRARARRATRPPSSRAAARAPARRCASARRARRSPRSRRSSGSARAQACPSRSSSSLTMIPLWIPTTGPWRTGWLLAAIDGWPLV